MIINHEVDHLNDISKAVIHKTFEHTKKVESDNRKSDGLDVSPIQEKIVINAAAESSESSDSLIRVIFIFTIRFFT